MTAHYHANGKQLLENGQHFGDMRDEATAETLAALLNLVPSLDTAMTTLADREFGDAAGFEAWRATVLRSLGPRS
jgi:hypothetical protein